MLTLSSPSSVATVQPHRWRAVDLLVRPLVVVLASTALILGGVGAYQATRQGAAIARHPSAAADLRLIMLRIETVRADFNQVPPGSRVLLRSDLDPAGQSAEWGQRLLEFAALRGVFLVAEARQADYVVGLVAAPGTPAGLRLDVHRTR